MGYSSENILFFKLVLRISCLLKKKLYIYIYIYLFILLVIYALLFSNLHRIIV
jgi:hypothetical protein